MVNKALKIVVIVMFFVSGCGGESSAGEISALPAKDVNTDPVSKILTDLQKTAAGLKSYQCKVEYLFSQPVLESRTLRTGYLYYARFGAGSKLRINFDTLTQDDGSRQKYIESYIFDGQWLTHIDYQIKQVQKRQLAEANEPIDAFELVKRNFPIIGFSGAEDLKKEFDVNLVSDSTTQTAGKSNGIAHLFMKVRPDSQYREDYESVDVWIDTAKTGLPDKITATSTNGDNYEIRFIEPKVNEPIDEKVFEFTIPDGFSKPEIIPLKKQDKATI